MGKYGDLIKSSPLVLVDFSASWCGPCQTLAPIIDRLAKKVGGKAKIVKIDVDKNQALASKLNVRGVPTLVLYKNGQPVWRQSGVVPEDQLLKLIEHHSAN